MIKEKKRISFFGVCPARNDFDFDFDEKNEIHYKNTIIYPDKTMKIKFEEDFDKKRIYRNLDEDFPRKLEFITKLPHSQISGSFYPTSENWYQGILYD